jgi:hypothetical protein
MFENIPELGVDLLRDRPDVRIPHQGEHHRRLGRLHVHGSVIAFEDVDVAGKEDANGRLGLQCPVRQRWVARGCGAVAVNRTGTVAAPDCRPVRELLGLGARYYRLGDN